MRSWTYWLGGYPSEITMYKHMVDVDTELDLTWAFWIYCLLFICFSIYSVIYQNHTFEKVDDVYYEYLENLKLKEIN